MVKGKGCGVRRTKIRSGKKDLLALVKKNKLGMKLDIGCGGNKQAGFVGMDIRNVKGVDIVHDVEDTPYPLPKECCSVLLASHLVEHICPRRFIDVMNEWWRLLQPKGQLWLSLPYGRSFGFMQDPTHCNPCNEATWLYFTPEQHILYGIYNPKPWKIVKSSFWEHGNMEVVMEKLSEKEIKKNAK